MGLIIATFNRGATIYQMKYYPTKDISEYFGKKFNRLTILSHAGWKKDKDGYVICIMVLCKCDCGKEKVIPFNFVTRGISKSCSCLQKEFTSKRTRTHNKTFSSEYRTWVGIKKRCLDKNNKFYSYYGGRGITMCDRWKNSFESFYEDMGDKQNPKLTLDRIDNNKGYYKENCRWATRKEQSANTRQRFDALVYTFKGKTMTLPRWCEALNLNYKTLHVRLKSGWTVEKSFTTPIQYKPSNKSNRIPNEI